MSSRFGVADARSARHAGKIAMGFVASEYNMASMIGSKHDI